MWRRSVTARRVSLTSYAIFLAEFGEDFAGRTCAAFGDILQPLAESLFWINLGGEVEEALVFGGVLEDGLGFAVDGEDDGALGLLKLLNELDGVVAEGGEGLDVLGDVETGWH
jgi:hypothetical protein